MKWVNALSTTKISIKLTLLKNELLPNSAFTTLINTPTLHWGTTTTTICKIDLVGVYSQREASHKLTWNNQPRICKIHLYKSVKIYLLFSKTKLEQTIFIIFSNFLNISFTTNVQYIAFDHALIIYPPPVIRQSHKYITFPIMWNSFYPAPYHPPPSKFLCDKFLFSHQVHKCLLKIYVCAYQEVRNISFSENLAYVLNGLSLTMKSHTAKLQSFIVNFPLSALTKFSKTKISY